MPRGKANSSSVAKPPEPEKPVESDEKVDLEEENDPEDEMEEEVEYEEVEEEVEEIEEEEEEEEEEEVEEEEEEEEEAVEEVEDEDEKKKHAELLSLPSHRSEVYIGGIPLDASTEDLKEFCERIGEVVEVRVMKGKDSSENKGFCFVTFRNEELASKAIEELNNTQFKGKKIKCSTSQAKAKKRLFIGNIPRSWSEEDLRKIVTKIGPGVTAVELVKDIQNTSNNRGFAFIDYYNNACADYSRQKMMSPTFKLDDNSPTVSWADPKDADSSASSQVKAVYVKNLPKNVTQEQLMNLFEHHGKITKVVLPPAKSGQEKNRIGFVHFAERSNALKALENTGKYELEGQILECSLAKPQADQKSKVINTQMQGLLQSYQPRGGYGLVAGGYGALGAGYGAPSLAQPLMYGPGQTPAGMAMMPMLLADGRIGYVLQQPGLQPQTPLPHQRGGRSSGGGGGWSGSRNGSSSSNNKGRYNNDSGQGRRYRPY